MSARLALAAIALLAASGCSGSGQLNIRPIGEAAANPRAPADRVALATGQLALGNVGLALEGFRRASREDPLSVEALLGIGACYERMARFDLSRHAYEQALAVSPDEPALYQALAASLQAQGLTAEANAVRREAANRHTAAVAPVVTPSGSVASLPTMIAEPGPSITLLLPPPRQVVEVPRAVRLERLSSGEVALLTKPSSPWTTRIVAAPTRSAPTRSASIRFDGRPAIVVLNAARVAGIAARTRDVLATRGFGRSRIGDAAMIARHSEIRFAPAQRARAMRLAAQLPFARPVAVASGPLTLVIGRNAPAWLLRRG